ncbi:hypothetical protein GF420_10800 [candidate division GN15 bacterium]|nr:hypothetical protein [candidate division GN15 bacterium]
MTMRNVLLTMLAICLLCVGHAGALDFTTSRDLGQARTVTFHYSTPSELLQLPTGSMPDRRWDIEAGFTRQYELSDFDQFFIAGAYRYGPVTAALGLAQQGSADLYREQLVKFSIAYYYRHFSLGASMSGEQVDITGDYHQLRSHAFGFGAGYRSDRFSVGFSADNLNKPTLYNGAVPRNPIYATYLELLGHRSFSFTGRITWEETEEVQLALGQRIALAESTSFTWGVGTNPVEYGVGIEFRFGRHVFSYAASYHPTLGLSFTVTLGTGGGPKLSDATDETFD